MEKYIKLFEQLEKVVIKRENEDRYEDNKLPIDAARKQLEKVRELYENFKKGLPNIHYIFKPDAHIKPLMDKYMMLK